MSDRARKIILISHCLLNVNSKVEGINPFPGVHKELLQILVEKDYGIIQLPCPEMTYFGISRWAHVRDQFDFPAFREHCQKLFKPILHQIQDYSDNGYHIEGIIFVEGSPSCGLTKVTKGENWKGVNSADGYAKLLEESTKIPGKGIFVQELEKLLNQADFKINHYVLDEKYPKNSLETLRLLL